MNQTLKTEKPRKAQKGHLEEGKTVRPTKGTKSGKPRKRAKKSSKSKNSKLPLKQLPLTVSMEALPLFLLSTTRLARVQPTLCTISPPLAMNSSNTIQEKNEMQCMRLKLGCFTRYTSNYTQHYTKTCKNKS
jgi:hypothetical protein